MESICHFTPQRHKHPENLSLSPLPLLNTITQAFLTAVPFYPVNHIQPPKKEKKKASHINGKNHDLNKGASIRTDLGMRRMVELSEQELRTKMNTLGAQAFDKAKSS